MNRTPVSSSNIASVGYDADSSTLEIEFNNGTVYQYFDVNENVYNELIGAQSIGGYLAANIKGRYRYSKV
ncbi:KTSC domain-containing protein [Paucibacter sp. PLA-PC-4]|uniref:KTSC domain-containing protein n=1 Tax=Paucibacter sp. PLA-PC-4 TaxID=2993655 RepID=UPI00224B88F1|nr:KTSC domain-containing protein [Paucibacter sp. PLA-PC-4]MCX2864605.1 KTSC domain-containing protein [Paucibacter sp. PLA-PC-4]